MCRRHVYSQNMLEFQQSAYRKHHSTEMILLSVCTEINTALDNRQGTLLVLLDLSSAFDTTDHRILLNRLCERFASVDDVVLITGSISASCHWMGVIRASHPDGRCASRLRPTPTAVLAVCAAHRRSHIHTVICIHMYYRVMVLGCIHACVIK